MNSRTITITRDGDTATIRRKGRELGHITRMDDGGWNVHFYQGLQDIHAVTFEAAVEFASVNAPAE